MLSNCENVSNETMNEKNLIGIYDGNQEKMEFNPDAVVSCSVDAYKLDENAVVGGVVWKPVNMDVFSDFYEVSDYGAVRSLHPSKYHRLMTPQEDKDGYLRYIFKGKGLKKYPHLQRLVALTFIPNTNNLPQVDHIDGNKMNNNVSNLRWVTNSENKRNPITLQVYKDTIAKIKHTEKYKKSKRRAVMKIALKRGHHIIHIETGEWFNSARVASKKLGCCFNTVFRHCNKYKDGNTKGCEFRYATEEENAINVPIYRETLLKSLGE